MAIDDLCSPWQKSILSQASFRKQYRTIIAAIKGVNALLRQRSIDFGQDLGCMSAVYCWP